MSMLTNRTFSAKAYDARYFETLDEGFRPAADDPASGYSADCRACLAGRKHSRAQHEEFIRRNVEASRA